MIGGTEYKNSRELRRIRPFPGAGALSPLPQSRRRITFHIAACLLLISYVSLAGAGAGKKDAEKKVILGCDYGSEWLKMAVATGLGTQSVDIVLNEQSGRKSLMAISFPEQNANEPLRSFCESAMAKPHRALTYLRELLGRAHTKGSIYGPHRFSHSLTAEDSRGACRVAASSKEFITPETVNAMLLSYAKHRAEDHAGHPLGKVVVTVPPFFTQQQRKALLSAGRIAGLDIVALISDGAAAALKYALDRVTFSEMDTYRRVVFYDMGATATKVALVQYSPAAVSLQGAKGAGGRIDVLGVSWDSTIGGAAFTDRLRDELAKIAEKDPSKDSRAMARLRASANKAKEVLSANKEAMVFVQDLIGTYDMKETVTREQLKSMCSDLCTRAATPIMELLGSLGLKVQDIEAVELVGNAWRMQHIQNELSQVLGENVPLRKSLNSDEFGANGAALAGLYLDPVLIGRLRFNVWDVMPYEVSLAVDDGSGQKQHYIAMPRNSPVPLIVPVDRGAGLEDVASASVVTVHSIRDFTAALYYSGAPACDQHASHPASALDTYAITGIEGEVQRAEAQGDMARVAGVDLHIVVDLYGLVSISYATLRLVVTSDAPAPPPPKALSNLRFKLPSPAITTKPSFISTQLDQNATQTKSNWGNGAKQKVEKEVLSYLSVSLLEEGKVGSSLLHRTDKSMHVRTLQDQELKEGQEIIKKWEEMEAQVKNRMELLNQLEGRVYALKELNTVLLEHTRIEASDSERMALDLEAMGEWCEDHGHSASVETIKEKRDLLESEVGNHLHKAERRGIRFDAIGAAKELSQNVKRRFEVLERKRPWLSKVWPHEETLMWSKQDGADSMRHGLARVNELIKEAHLADLPGANEEDGLVDALVGEGMRLTNLIKALEDDIRIPGLKPRVPGEASLYGLAREQEKRRLEEEEMRRRIAGEAERLKKEEEEEDKEEEPAGKPDDGSSAERSTFSRQEENQGRSGGLLKRFLDKFKNLGGQ